MVVTALQTAPHYFPPFSLHSLTLFLHFDHFFTPSWLASSAVAGAGVFPLFIFLLRLVLLPQLLSRYVFSWGSIRCGISLCAGVHQCLSARTQPERLHGGYCHCGTIITSAVSQTGVCPHIHTCTHSCELTASSDRLHNVKNYFCCYFCLEHPHVWFYAPRKAANLKMNVNISILVYLCAFVCTVSPWGSFVWADLYNLFTFTSCTWRCRLTKTARRQKNAALIKGLDDIFEEILPRGCTSTAVSAKSI